MMLFLLLSTLLTIVPVESKQKPTVVYLVGDSTCADKVTDAYPETGWGSPFKTFFDENIQIENRAKNGRSTRTFISEGLWDDVFSTLKEGDFVFIQFGHNDASVEKTDRYTSPDDFRNNLNRMIQDAKSKNAQPVLLSPVSRRTFKNGILINSHEHYAAITRDVAASSNVPLIDMTNKSMALLNSWGEENSKLLFLQLEAGEHPNYPNGRVDNTHFNELGARKMAQLVLEGIREQQLTLVNNIVVGKR
jgi:lysophospholipase L1-like esterase